VVKWYFFCRYVKIKTAVMAKKINPRKCATYP